MVHFRKGKDMKTYQKILVLGFIIFLFGAGLLKADETPVPASTVPLNITLNIRNANPADFGLADPQGTDFVTIYRIEVACAAGCVLNQMYPYLAFYLDGLELLNYNKTNGTLPYFFMFDFRGQPTGQHTIRAVVEKDPKTGEVWAETSAVINVSSQ